MLKKLIFVCSSSFFLTTSFFSSTKSPFPLQLKKAPSLSGLMKESSCTYSIITRSRHKAFPEESMQISSVQSQYPFLTPHSSTRITQITLFCRGTILSGVSPCGMCTLFNHPNPENVHPRAAQQKAEARLQKAATRDYFPGIQSRKSEDYVWELGTMSTDPTPTQKQRYRKETEK